MENGLSVKSSTKINNHTINKYKNHINNIISYSHKNYNVTLFKDDENNINEKYLFENNRLNNNDLFNFYFDGKKQKNKSYSINTFFE